MGISADLLKVCIENDGIELKDSKYMTDDYIIFNFNENSFIKNDLKKYIVTDSYGDKYILGKIIAYIGSGKEFKENVLENYDENLGTMSSKDLIKYCNKEKIDELTEYLKITKENLESDEKYFFTLNY